MNPSLLAMLKFLKFKALMSMQNWVLLPQTASPTPFPTAWQPLAWAKSSLWCLVMPSFAPPPSFSSAYPGAFWLSQMCKSCSTAQGSPWMELFWLSYSCFTPHTQKTRGGCEGDWQGYRSEASVSSGSTAQTLVSYIEDRTGWIILALTVSEISHHDMCAIYPYPHHLLFPEQAANTLFYGGTKIAVPCRVSFCWGKEMYLLTLLVSTHHCFRQGSCLSYKAVIQLPRLHTGLVLHFQI